MNRNNHMLDADAVLRFLLEDVEAQFQQIKSIIGKERCFVTLEVMAEVSYVLEGLYHVPRKEIVKVFRRLNVDIVILNADVFLRALEIFDKNPKLDFVDCLLCGYQAERNMDILTFDKRLSDD